MLFDSFYPEKNIGYTPWCLHAARHTVPRGTFPHLAVHL